MIRVHLLTFAPMSDTLYIGCNAYVAAIRVATGEEAWRTHLTAGFLTTTGQDTTVLEHEGRVYAGVNGHVFCLDAATGGVLWHNELPGVGHNDVALSIGGHSVQFIAKHTHTHS
jgi:outer membrane protein assembly factor BamB